jgi:hypothetical protein
MNPELEIAVDGVNQVVLQNELATLSDPNKDGMDDTAICANCGAVLLGKYCHACGQSGHLHHSLLHMLEELGHGLFHFDTKAWRTFPSLVLRPGRLTRDYISGKRTRFVSPLALFLFMMFFMFFVFSFSASTNINNELSKEALSQAKLELQTQLDEQVKSNAEFIANNKPTKEQEKLIGETKKAIQEIDSKLITLSSASAATASVNEEGLDFNNFDKKISKKDLHDNLQINIPFFSKEKLEDKIYHALQNKELAFYKLKSGIAKFTFLLVPLSLPFFWLMFAWRRQYTMFDHAVFSLYSLSFMALLFSALSILVDLGFVGFASILFVLVPPIHIFQQLRHAYQLGVFSSLWRTLALSFLALIVITLYIVIVLGLSL